MKQNFTLLLSLICFALSAQNFQVYNEPPTSNAIRSMAEWEETGTLIVSWTNSSQGSWNAILAQIIDHAQTECNVMVLCNNPNITISYLENNYNISLSDNVQIFQTDINSIWVRDYGPNTVYLDNDELAVVDWIYNRNSRPEDNTSPTAVAEELNIPIYITDEGDYAMVHTGGNYHTDGNGLGFSSKLILEENEPGNIYGVEPLTEEEINEIMSSFMGIDSYIKMEALPYDIINHIDMHFRLLDEETLLVGQYPEGVSDGPQIEANLLYVIDNTTNQFGAPWNVVRIPMPPVNGAYPPNASYRTYTNSVIVNDKILVPFYQEQYDTTAQRIYEENMPGYEVIGINCNGIIGASGALHCITKEVGSPDPLRIVHEKVKDQYQNTDAIPVRAQISHKSGLESVNLYYRLNETEDFSALAMSPLGGNNWEAFIPNEVVNDTLVHYYVEATANSGKKRARPVPAPEGYYSFVIDIISSTANFEPINASMEAAFPNPSKGITCIPLESKIKQDIQLNLLDVNGRLIQSIFQGSIPQGQSRYYLQAGDYPAGQYIIELKGKEQTSQQKLIIN